MRLHFKESGQGRAVILLHGLFGSSDNWFGVAPRLTKMFPCLILTCRIIAQLWRRLSTAWQAET